MARRLIINYGARRRERIGATVGAGIGAKGSRAIVRHKASTAPFLAAATIVDVLVPGALAAGLVPVALDQSYSYRVPAGRDLAPGDVVRVPLGARETTGVVWADNVAVQPGLHNPLPRGA